MTFTPALMTITDITQALPPVVTTEDDHGIFTGEIVRMIIPPDYGMTEINNRSYIVTVLSADTFSLQYSQTPIHLDVDARTYTAFTNPATGTPAQAIPIGSGPTPDLGTFLTIRNGIATTTTNDQVFNDSTIPIPF